MSPIRKILVATDFSLDALQAELSALELARTVGASVTLIHLYRLPTYMFFDGSTYVPSAKVVSEVISDAEHKLRLAQERAAEVGMSVEVVAEEGSPYERIVGFAEEHDFDLIVVGTHGRRGLDRLALGSVAERVVRTAHVPVLTLHGERDEHPPVMAG
jgi:nucleotide-binding universal stress UspA family protein